MTLISPLMMLLIVPFFIVIIISTFIFGSENIKGQIKILMILIFLLIVYYPLLSLFLKNTNIGRSMILKERQNIEQNDIVNYIIEDEDGNIIESFNGRINRMKGKNVIIKLDEGSTK